MDHLPDELSRPLTDAEVAAIFSPAVLESESDTYIEKRKAWWGRMSARQRQRVTEKRRKRQNCQYAKRARNRRIARVAELETENAALKLVVKGLRKENEALQRAARYLTEQLATFMGLQ